MARIYKYNYDNEGAGKPHIIVLMFDNHKGVSLPGGALGAGVVLTFGDPPDTSAFYDDDWTELTKEEYRTIIHDSSSLS